MEEYENEVVPSLGTEPENPPDAESSETTEEEAGAEPEEVEGTEETTGEDTPAAPKKENKVQKRIDELTREKYEAQRERDYYKGLAEGRGKSTDEPAPVVNIPGLPPKPTADQFDDYDQYIEAVADWTADKKLLERDHKQQQAQAEESQKTAYEKHQERVKAVATVHEDYDDAIEAVSDIPFASTTINGIIESDSSAEIGYYLGKNRAEAERISKLTPVKQLVEIGKIEASLEKKKAEPQPKRITQAPAPIIPVNAKQSLAPDPANMTDDEWLAHENERLRKLGRLY